MRHLFLGGLHGAVDVALASLHVILGHQLLRRFHFLRGCRLCLTLAHGLNVSFHRVYGRVVTFSMMPLMAKSQSKWKPRKTGHKEQAKRDVPEPQIPHVISPSRPLPILPR